MPEFALIPKTAADYSGNVRAGRALVAEELGIGGVTEGTSSEYSALSQAEQIRLTEELAAFIAKNKQFFTADQVSTAERLIDSQHFRSPLADPSIRFTDFGDAFLDEAVNLANKASLSITGGLGVAASVLVILWLAPQIIQRWRKQ